MGFPERVLNGPSVKALICMAALSNVINDKLTIAFTNFSFYCTVFSIKLYVSLQIYS